MQFDKPTIDLPTNQAKLAEMFSGLYNCRLLVYHAAHLLDEHEDAMVEASTAKMLVSDTYEKLISDAIQVMGGDGWTRFYPVEAYLRDAKVNQIGAGTNQIMKLVIFRGGLKTMGKDLKMLHRRMDTKLRVPVSTTEPETKRAITKETVLRILTEDYIVNPGLYMTREDLKEKLSEPDDLKLSETLRTLETEGLVKLYRGGREAIDLAKATYAGLRKALPLEKYKWFPEWLSKDLIF
jgi:hypothetical protein